MSQRILKAAAFAFGLIVTQAAHAQAVVMRASGPSANAFPQGAILRESAQIKLVEGDTLSVMISGGTQIMRGPYFGPVQFAEPGKVRRVNFADLFKSRQRVRIAGARGGD